MPQQPFTPAGVKEKQAELNALSQQELEAQADLIRSDLGSWVNTNFTLDTTQQTYLENINADFIKLASGLTGFAVENKLPVTLTVTGTPTPVNQGLKLIHINNTLSAISSVDGLKAAGALVYEAEYPAS